MLQFQASADPE